MVIGVVHVCVGGKIGKAVGQRLYKLVARRCMHSGDLTHSKVISVNNTVLYTSKAYTLDLEYSHHKREVIIM